MIPWMGRAFASPDVDTKSGAFDFGMTDVEERLRATDGEAARADILDRFKACEDELRALLIEGLTPQDFETIKVAREALAHARKLVLAFR